MNISVKQQSIWIIQSDVTEMHRRQKRRGRTWSRWSLVLWVIVVFFALVLCIHGHAQNVMKIGSYTEVERQYEKYIDLVLPTAETLVSGWI